MEGKPLVFRAENRNVKTRKLGNSGLEVGPLALGGNVFGWTADEPSRLGWSSPG